MDFLRLLIHPNQTIMRVTVATARAAGKWQQLPSSVCRQELPAGTAEKAGYTKPHRMAMGLVKSSATSLPTAPVQRSPRLMNGIITMDRWIKRTSF